MSIFSDEFHMRLPKMPIGLKQCIDGLDDRYKMQVLSGLMPLLATYATNAICRYNDRTMRLNLMSVIYGKSASGKSIVKDYIDIWSRPLQTADEAGRAEEEAFRQRRKNRKANEKLPEEPHALIREVPITISCSGLLKRLKNAQSRHLYSFGEELDTLRKTNGAGSWSSKYDVYRLAFDNGRWGQDYVSDNAESGVVNVAYNWTILGTVGALYKCFKQDSIENGMSGRVLFSRMPDQSFEHISSIGKMPGEDTLLVAAVEKAVHILQSTCGEVETPRLEKAIKNWVNAKADEAKRISQSDNEADRHRAETMDLFRKRAAVIGFRCGVIYHLLEQGELAPNGNYSLAAKESKAETEFGVLMADYCLFYQMNLFSGMMADVVAVAADEAQRLGKNIQLFDELPSEFVWETVLALRPEAQTNALRVMICRWHKQHLITEVAKNHWRKVSVLPPPPIIPAMPKLPQITL